MNTRLLTSIMIIGFVGAGLTSTTMAMFNDTETSADNEFVTGELDLQIDWEESYNGEHVETQKLTDNPGSIFNLEDLKPGDHGEATVSLHLDDNPGWVWMNLNQTYDGGYSCTEPEKIAEDGDCGTKGELDEELEFTIWADDGDNVRQEDEKIIFEGTYDELEEHSTSEGVLLDGNPETDEKEPFPGGETGYVGIKWKLPLDTGNKVQSDAVKFDLSFYTEQRRHNDNPENPWNEDTENQPPVASFERANNKPMETTVGTDVRLFSTSTDDNEIAKKKWDLGDDTTKFGQDVWHSWDSEGNYTVTLEVTDSDGEKDSVNKIMTVTEDQSDNGSDEPGTNETEYTATQGDETTEITPIEGDEPVEDLYDFRLPDAYDNEADNNATNGASYGSGPHYGSAGTEDLQQADTSLMFLYDGPEGLSLVVVHEGVGSEDGGTATFEISNLNSDGEWIVKDDLYLNSDGSKASSNYDNWNVESDPQVIDWAWQSGGSDGGVFNSLSENFSFTIDPAFNEEAGLRGEFDNHNGEVDEWQVLSGERENPDRTNLNMTEEVTVQAQ